MPTYEIVRRSDAQHRAGQFSIIIDGWDSEYTNNPAQHAPKMLAQAIADGYSPEAAAIHAHELCEERSKLVLERIVDRLKRGRLFPGGAPIGVNGIDDNALPRTKAFRATAEQATRSFMNRGNFTVTEYDSSDVPQYRPMTEDERRERIVSRDTKIDHVAEWQARRKALVALRNQQLEKLKSELTSCPRVKLPKLQKAIQRLEVEIVGLTGSGIFNATHGFQYANGQLMTKQVDMVNDDLRIVPLMTNTTVDTERDAKDAVSDFTTLDEFDGSGYSTGGLALDTQAVNIDDANDRAEFDAADEVVATLAAGTRAIDGILLIAFISSLSASLPIHWLEFASDQTPGGGSFTFQFNAEGIVQAA